jgi:hypothetical protein
MGEETESLYNLQGNGRGLFDRTILEFLSGDE